MSDRDFLLRYLGLVFVSDPHGFSPGAIWQIQLGLGLHLSD